jgi:short-subunit dehydrogenase
MRENLLTQLPEPDLSVDALIDGQFARDKMDHPSFYLDKLILVTGASSGIGQALAIEFSKRGASVAFVGRDAVRLDRAVAAGGSGGKAFTFDLSDIPGIKDLTDTIENDFGRPIDIVVHAAGTATVGRVEETPVVDMRETVVTNLVAAMALSQAVLPGMRSRGVGKLVFISSGTANFGVPSEAAYSASKAGLERLSEALRIELAESGVSVCVVSPGPVETPLMRTPRRYGNSELVGRPVVAPSPEVIAYKIGERLPSGKARIELSFRGSIARHLSYWTPGVLGWLLSRQAGLKSKS